MICENGTRLKRYILTDCEGNEVSASGSDIVYLDPILQQYNVIDVTNAQVPSVAVTYRILKHPNQWRLGRETLISHVPDAEPNLLYFLDILTPFDIIDKSFMRRNIPVDIMGIIIAVEECKPSNCPGTNKNQFQRFIFVNNERKPMAETVWNPTLAEQNNLIMEAIEKSDVVVAKILRTT